jgi:2-polyprenyl-6-methoxyphenol hydroxylase-like FAD-dependent oxidoreductase
LSASSKAKRAGANPILIAGGGIGGLALSLALAPRPARVLERSSFADESGAGIQLGPNATRALRAIGALDAIEAYASRPEALILFDAISGKRLATMPLGDEIEARYSAPYLTLHRADLHAGLLERSRDHGSLELSPAFSVTGVEETDASVTAHGNHGQKATGSILIAADGLWSTLRAHVAPGAVLRATGQTAWRSLLPRTRLPAPFDVSIVGLWLAPGAHLVHYPVRGGKELNLVVIVDHARPANALDPPSWNVLADPAALLAHFARWSAAPRSLLEMATGWRAWSLHTLQPLHRWSAGRIALLGDTAHPVLPFLAQGAALAIEDAVTLAGCLEADTGEPSLAFPRYEALRAPRAARVQRRSAQMGSLYHLGTPLRFARNMALRTRSPQNLLDSFAWLYGAKGDEP